MNTSRIRKIRRMAFSIQNVTTLVFYVSEESDEIRLRYADNSETLVWEASRIKDVARAIVEMTGLEEEVNTL